MKALSPRDIGPYWHLGVQGQLGVYILLGAEHLLGVPRSVDYGRFVINGVLE